MPDVWTLLPTLAELAVAFAGFGGLASGLAARAGEDRVDAGRLINMLTASLAVVVLALAQVALALFGLADDWIWRTSASLALLIMIVTVPGILHRTRRMAKFAPLHRGALVTNVSLWTAAAVFFVLCVAGWPTNRLPATFVAGLVALLVSSAILFFRIIFSMLRSVRPD